MADCSKIVTNMDDNIQEMTPPNNGRISPETEHALHMEARDFCKHCETEGVPVFLAYYLPVKGYKYRAVLPEEINNEDIVSQYGKFKDFLRVCIGFNKEDYFPKIN